MSTDPREFEHPIDGTGGVTPEAVEVAARVNAYLADFSAKYGSASGFVDSVNVNQSNALYADDLARLTAFVTAAPLIAAQAKAEALREAAGELSGVCADFAYMRADGLIEYATPEDWLLARAATIEGKSE